MQTQNRSSLSPITPVVKTRPIITTNCQAAIQINRQNTLLSQIQGKGEGLGLGGWGGSPEVQHLERLGARESVGDPIGVDGIFAQDQRGGAQAQVTV